MNRDQLKKIKTGSRIAAIVSAIAFLVSIATNFWASDELIKLDEGRLDEVKID